MAYCNLKKVILWVGSAVGTVNMNIKGLVGHKGDSKIMTLRGGI